MSNLAKGKLILLIGVSGSGKTTLVRSAIETLSNLYYLKTVTTRVPRSDWERDHSFEYEFVTMEEYFRRLRRSSQWDHSVIYNHFYGADLAEITERIKAGQNFIINVAPQISLVEEIRLKYPGRKHSILIKTPFEVIDVRMKNERSLPEQEERRIWQDHLQLEIGKLESDCDFVFVPNLELESDCQRFCVLVQTILLESYR